MKGAGFEYVAQLTSVIQGKSVTLFNQKDSVRNGRLEYNKKWNEKALKWSRR